jgi:hypothetical protein
MIPALFEHIQQCYQQMHISILQFILMRNELLHTSVNHVKNISDIKHKILTNRLNFVFYITEVGHMIDRNL